MKRIPLILTIIFLAAACANIEAPISTGEEHPHSAPTEIATEHAEEWHYVSLGDSTVYWTEMNRMYSGLLEEDLGIEIVIHNWAHGSGGSERLIEELENNDELRNELRAADVITIQIPTHAWGKPMSIFSRNPVSCGGDDHQACLRETLDKEKENIDHIFRIVTELADPSDTLIRAQDTYLFHVGEMKEAGSFETLNAYWKKEQEYIHQVASQYDIPVAQVYDRFMGPEGKQNPADQGLMDDNTHASQEGSRIMAEMIRDLGYEYASPGGN